MLVQSRTHRQMPKQILVGSFLHIVQAKITLVR